MSSSGGGVFCVRLVSSSTLLFLGIQALSVAATAAIALEYLRICRKRAAIFQSLGDASGRGRAHALLLALYLLTTLLIFILSSYAFGLTFPLS